MAANIFAYGVPLLDVVVEVTCSKSGGVVKGMFLNAAGSDYATTTDATAGVTLNDADNGDSVSCIKSPVAMCKAGGVIAQYALVELSSGKVVTHSSSTIRGTALEASGADGDMIPVLLSTGA